MFVPLLVQLRHQLAGIIFVFYNKRENILNQIFAPSKPVNNQLILPSFAQQFEMPSFANNVLTHRISLGYNSAAVDDEGEFLKEPILWKLVLIDFPGIWIEEGILVGHLKVFAKHAASVDIAPVRIGADDESAALNLHKMVQKKLYFLIN